MYVLQLTYNFLIFLYSILFINFFVFLWENYNKSVYDIFLDL
jgi:hypothetical protein